MNEISAVFLSFLISANLMLAPPPTLRLNDQRLVAVSCAVEQPYLTRAFTVGLYLPAQAQPAHALSDSASAKALSLRVVESDKLPNEIPDMWRQPLAQHIGAKALARTEAAYRLMRVGDDLVLGYTPDEGSSLRINGQVLARVDGHGLIEALLATWADGVPLEPKLRRVIARNPCLQAAPDASEAPRT